MKIKTLILSGFQCFSTVEVPVKYILFLLYSPCEQFAKNPVAGVVSCCFLQIFRELLCRNGFFFIQNTNMMLLWGGGMLWLEQVKAKIKVKKTPRHLLCFTLPLPLPYTPRMPAVIIHCTASFLILRQNNSLPDMTCC